MSERPPGRDDLGRWLPGYVPNPTGRPKSEPDIVRQARAASPRAIRRLVELIRATRPRVVILPFPIGRHPDHRVAAEPIARSSANS